jgi:uncharacterized membrane protein YraQ (UPF0718 family)
VSLTYNYVLIGITIGMIALSLAKSRQKTSKALRIAIKTFMSSLPFFIAVFILIGLVEVFATPDIIVSLMGTSRGALATVFAAIVGGLMSGPPAASYPMAKVLVERGASIASVATLIVAWVAVGTISLPVEIKLLGQRFAWTRWILTLFLSIALGIVLGWIL